MRACLLLALVLGSSPAGAADELVVIGHPGLAVSSLTPQELSSIYLLKMVSWRNGETIVPVNRDAASSARTRFSDAILRQPPNALNAYWNQMHFMGKVLPTVQESDHAVLAFVQRVPGAIGYISAAVAPKNVKVLAKVP